MDPSASAQHLHHQRLQSLPKDSGAPLDSRDVQLVRDFIDSPYEPFLILNPTLMTVMCVLDPRPHCPDFTRRWYPTTDGQTMFSVDEVNYTVAPHAVNPIAVVVPGTGQDLKSAPTKRLVNTLVQHDFAVLVLNYRGVPSHTEAQSLETETETNDGSVSCGTPSEEQEQEKQKRKQRSVPRPTLKLMRPAFTDDLHTLVDIVREQHACVDIPCGDTDRVGKDDDNDNDDGRRTLTSSRVDNCSSTKEETWKKKQEGTAVRNMYICGFSLGGNIALHYAYESRPSAGGSSSDNADNATHSGTPEHNDNLFKDPAAATEHHQHYDDDHQHKKPLRGIHIRVRAFAAVSVPFDVAYCAEHLNRGWRAWLFGLPLAQCVRLVVNHAIRQRAPGHDRMCVRDVRRMWSMRDVATHYAVPVFEYKDADACFQAMDVCDRLKHVDYVPVLVIQAKDDPYFGHDRTWDVGDDGDDQGGVLSMMQEQTPPGVRIRVSEHGGHCAFADGNWLRDANSGFFQKEFARWFLHFEENGN